MNEFSDTHNKDLRAVPSRTAGGREISHTQAAEDRGAYGVQFFGTGNGWKKGAKRETK